MASMSGSGRLSGMAPIDLGLTPQGKGFGGDELKKQTEDEVKKRRKKSYTVTENVLGNAGMNLLANANAQGPVNGS